MDLMNTLWFRDVNPNYKTVYNVKRTSIIRVYKRNKMTKTKKQSIRSSDNRKFRKQSATKSRSYSLKNKPTRSNQQSCHKIPNAIMGNAHHKTSHNNVRKDLMGHAHSSSNIIYSSNNHNHSKMERRLSSNSYTQADVRQKGGSIGNSLRKLHHVQNSAATSHVMRELRHSGGGNNAVVAGFDKRTFNNSSEKQQIGIARRTVKK